MQTDHANYLLVVTRTACVLYQILSDSAARMCSYIINARKKQSRRENKYSYKLRYYFTTARIQVLSKPVREDKKEAVEQHMDSTADHLTTTATAMKKPSMDTEVLVCIGDSRGFVHMNTLYLK